MLKVHDKSLWVDLASAPHRRSALDIGYVVGVASMTITISLLVLTLLLSEKLSHARGIGPDYAATELLATLESYKRACLRSFDKPRPTMVRLSSQDINLEKLEILRRAIDGIEEENQQRFPGERLEKLIKQISPRDSELSHGIAQKISLLRMIEISELSSLGSDAEGILLRAARVTPSGPKPEVASEFSSLVDHRQALYSRHADDVLNELEKELAPILG